MGLGRVDQLLKVGLHTDRADLLGRPCARGVSGGQGVLVKAGHDLHSTAALDTHVDAAAGPVEKCLDGGLELGVRQRGPVAADRLAAQPQDAMEVHRPALLHLVTVPKVLKAEERGEDLVDEGLHPSVERAHDSVGALNHGRGPRGDVRAVGRVEDWFKLGRVQEDGGVAKLTHHEAQLLPAPHPIRPTAAQRPREAHGAVG